MKVVSIVGARPQFVKAAMISKVIRKKHEEVLVHTGQHYDEEMSQVFFDVMKIPKPEYNLNIGSGSQGEQTALMLDGIEKVLIKEKPDWMVVYGDTNSTLAGALAAVKLHIPIAHIEAGLRSFNMHMPEEVNRRITDHVSKLLFCPTEVSVKNLEEEGIVDGVHLVGDVMFDAVEHYGQQETDILQRLGLKPKEYYFLTTHRPSNTDDKTNLQNIMTALENENIIFPAHPRTVASIEKHGIELPDNIRKIKPVHYLDSLTLIKNAKKVITDSGGIQKEAYFLGTPCITLREETEWVETVEDGWNILTGADTEKIKDGIENFDPTGERSSSYGDGKASEKIVKIIENEL
ncbi:MAG: UDP-N-acetylglucosamine 2-epimerase (non-hydrolyzing) [Thermoplasmata archaeon]|nr:UDP-N-acetylglucosamine 2-epimerase (non-hydrolyzing) [Thermoplasmata archaeon]